MRNEFKMIITCYTMILLSCGQGHQQEIASKTEPKEKAQISYPYVLIDKRKELRKNDGTYNEMSIYSAGNTINVDTLKLFCKTQKDSVSDGYFHIWTFFDHSKNAVFEDIPVTAGFMEEKNLKHIKAVYTYNTQNGYSKLMAYKDNNWISKAVEYDIK